MVHLLLGILLRRFGPRHEVLQRRLALLFQFRMRQRLARQHLVAHGGVIHKDGFHYGRLSKVFRLQAFVGIHVRMVSA